MKNGKVKSLEVSYYSNGGNSADLSYGVSKRSFLIVNYVEDISLRNLFLQFKRTYLQQFLYILHADMIVSRFWWVL